jgi:hypothetical protein
MTKGSVEKDRKSSNSSITSKPKIKLRLSLKKSKSDDASTLDQDTATTITTTTMPPKTTSSEASKKKVKSKGSGGGSSAAAGGTTTTNSAYPPSRGKELPKTVASTQQQKQQKKKNNSISPQSSKQQTATAAGSRSTHPPSRGKEIPKSIAATQQQTAVVVKQQPVAPSLAPQQQTNRNIPTPLAHTAMTEERKVQCLKFISALKRRQHRNVSWFLKPVSDPRLIDDYIAKIPYPSDLGTVTAKLISEHYATIPDFVRDIRRIFGNCLRYNTSAGDTFRKIMTLKQKKIAMMHLLF